MEKNNVKLCKLVLAVLLVAVLSSNGAYAYDGPWPKVFDFTVAPIYYGFASTPRIDQYGFYNPNVDWL